MVKKGFKHSKISRAKISISLLGRRCSMASEWKRGQTPWNKGTKGKGICRANSGTFKKGQKPANYRGGYKATEDGIYVLTGHKICNSKNGKIIVGAYENLARLKYREAHGEFDKKLIVVHKDGDVYNCEIENLELITRSENLNRNKKTPRNCIICGTEFMTTNGGQKTCSKKCRMVNNNNWNKKHRKRMNEHNARYRERKRKEKENSLLNNKIISTQYL